MKPNILSNFPAPAVLAASLFLVACNAYSPQQIPPGTPVNQVVERLGPATAQHQPPPEQSQAKSRLEFARGPMGKHTYMLDFDAQGRLLAWEQVLTEARFFKVEPGWRQAQVSAWLGTPSNVRSVGWRGETVWSYRYETPFCVWFEVSLMQSVVVGSGHGPDPQCEDKGDRRHD
ncbi:MAG: hypothetical protein ACKOF9_00785 [Burkholderiales bacterium]